MQVLSGRKQETRSHRMWTCGGKYRLMYSTTFLPQSSLAIVPVTLELQDAKAETGRIKNHPLEKINSDTCKETEGAQVRGTWWDTTVGPEGTVQGSTKPLPIMFEKLWQSGEIPSWERVNITLTLEKGDKEDLGNHRSVSLTSVSSKIMEKFLLKTPSDLWQPAWPSLMGLQYWWIQKEHLISSCGKCEEHVKLSWMTL